MLPQSSLDWNSNVQSSHQTAYCVWNLARCCILVLHLSHTAVRAFCGKLTSQIWSVAAMHSLSLAAYTFWTTASMNFWSKQPCQYARHEYQRAHEHCHVAGFGFAFCNQFKKHVNMHLGNTHFPTFMYGVAGPDTYFSPVQACQSGPLMGRRGAR